MKLGCQTCLRVIGDPSEGFFINSADKNDELPIKEKLLDVVPDLVLESNQKAILCNSCMESLMSAYKFKQHCIDTQEKIHGFLQLVPKNDAIDVGKIAEHYHRLELIAQGITPVIEDENILDVDNNEPYKCDKCAFIYPTSALLREHLATHEEPFSCKFCDFVTISQQKLTEHTVTHNEDVECRICRLRFSTTFTLAVHKMKTHKKSKKLFYICGLCKFRCESVKTVKSHINGCLQNVRIPFHCGVCDFKTAIPKTLVAHIQKTHYALRHCEPCHATFGNRKGLKKHIKKVHTTVTNAIATPTSAPNRKRPNYPITPTPSDMVLKQSNWKPKDFRASRKLVKAKTAPQNSLGPPCKLIKLEHDNIEPPIPQVLVKSEPFNQEAGKTAEAFEMNLPKVSITPNQCNVWRPETLGPSLKMIKSEPTIPETSPIISNSAATMVSEQLRRWNMEAGKK